MLLGIIVLSIVVLFTVLSLAFYKKIPSNKLLVKHGLGVKNGYLIKRGGGVFVIPFLQGTKEIDLGLMNTDVKLKEVLSLNKIAVNLVADATFKVSSNIDEQEIVAETLMSSDLSTISNIAQEIIAGELRSVIANLTINEINSNREKLKEEASKNIETELSKIGLDLKNLNLKSITDTAGVLEQMGLKSASEIKNKAMVDVAEQNKFGRSAAAKLEADTIISEKNSEISRTQAFLNAEQKISQNKIETEKNIIMSRTEAEKEANIQKELTSQEILTQQTETAKKNAELKLETLRAQELVAKRIENEKEVLDNDTDLKVQLAKNETSLKIQTANAENELFIAHKKAEAITIAAKAEADALKMKAEAQAELIALPKIREAEAVKVLNEALSGQSQEITQYLIQMEFIKQLPQIVQAEAQAMQAIGFKDITILGGGNGAEGASNAIAGTVGDIMKIAPAMTMAMQMMKKINLVPEEEIKEVK